MLKHALMDESGYENNDVLSDFSQHLDIQGCMSSKTAGAGHSLIMACAGLITCVDGVTRVVKLVWGVVFHHFNGLVDRGDWGVD